MNYFISKYDYFNVLMVKVSLNKLLILNQHFIFLDFHFFVILVENFAFDY